MPILRFGYRRGRTRQSPAATARTREWIGIGSIALLVLVIDRFSTYVFFLSFAGLIYIAAIVYVTCWAGFRSAIISCALLVGYAWLIYHYPISAFGRDPSKATVAIISTAITYPLIATITGLVQAKLRAAATRESEARAELWASEAMRRIIVNASLDAIIGVAGDGRITMWNPNAEKLFGWSQHEALGKPVAERIVPAADEERFPDFGSDPSLREPIETTVRAKDGSELAIELYVVVNRTEEGIVSIAFARDIGDRNKAQQAIREMNAKLEERVAERTAQLEEANNELVGFTYTVSHDLRTPLRAIVSNSRIAREEAEHLMEPAITERLARLERNALKMAELIENLLQFARVGQMALNVRPVNITAMAEGIARDLQHNKPGSIEIQPGLVAEGDPQMIQMLLLNLLENAWKYVRPGEQPDVKVGKTADGTFYVRDSGVGFDMAYVDKIWVPFERLHREDEYPGTGIGLANSKRIVDRHGGRIWSESAPNMGTTMYFELAPKNAAQSSRKAAIFAS
ncbi:MAG TPA: ATP-binding protein [Fimbriimonadaceae bacterium]|nr:ATP-binding protein [Fimbriimonadaceae bacterium]